MELKNNSAPLYETSYSVTGITGTNTIVTMGISGDPSNCKLSYIHKAGCLSSFTTNQKKEIIDKLLTVCKGAVIINTTNKTVADWISKNYPTYFYNEVPIGYGSSFQYMLCIKNTITINTACREPVKIDTTALQKEVIKQKLVKVLTEKRRKGDYVDEFINSL